MALVARLTRSSMREILGRDFIRTGRAKGLAERAVILRHALRNAAVPLLTVLGLQIGTLLGGAVITESVFAWPGMGKLVVDAIFFRDFPVVQTVLILSATIFVVLIAALVGILVGLVAGSAGERRASLLMRAADVQLAFPVIMLAIAIVAVVGTSPGALVGVLALSGWVLYARTVRASVLTIRRLEYVEAAYTLGASDLRIIARHILPNTIAPILVLGSSQVATMVLLEAGLSLLGMGIQAPRPSRGLMRAEGRGLLSDAWWLATIPGIAISLVVLWANLLGGGLRDLLDPRWEPLTLSPP